MWKLTNQLYFILVFLSSMNMTVVMWMTQMSVFDKFKCLSSASPENINKYQLDQQSY